MVTHPAAGIGIGGKETARINNVLCGPERRLTIEHYARRRAGRLCGYE
jgi:hypothetical protein